MTWPAFNDGTLSGPAQGGFASYPSLRDRVVFITGGASGIGAEVVRQFAAQGAQVATVDIVPQPELPTEVWFRVCDVTDTPSLQQAIADVADELGPIRVLVNNAARDDRSDTRSMTEAEWDAMQAVNLRHAFFASQAVRPHMTAAGGGSIINYTSPSVDHQAGELVAYATAKAGIYGLTRTLAANFGPDGIRVNAVQPGWVFTDRQRELWVTSETVDEVLAGQTIRELTTEADVARLILFLGADDSRLITSQVYRVDAGWT